MSNDNGTGLVRSVAELREMDRLEIMVAQLFIQVTVLTNTTAKQMAAQTIQVVTPAEQAEWAREAVQKLKVVFPRMKVNIQQFPSDGEGHVVGAGV